METGPQHILKLITFEATFSRTLSTALLTACCTAQIANASESIGTVLVPTIERKTIEEPSIDKENFEIGAFTGLVSIENFGSNIATGLYVNYYASELIYFQASTTLSEAEETSFETLTGIDLLTDNERDFVNYSIAAGINLLPGESFYRGTRTYNSSLFGLVGVGATDFGADEHFTLSFTFGYRLLLSDFLSIQLQATDHVFNMKLTGKEKRTHNITWNMGAGIFF